MSAAWPGQRPEDAAMNAPGETQMKPFKSILDRSFNYVPSTATSVDQTWRRFGWRPTNEEGTTHESHAMAKKHASQSSSVQQ
jgi:hypothetical protein